jgi:PAS domain S-box-containing protein
VMGFAMSGLLALTVLLAQRSLRSARDAERARIASALDRSTDGIWEWDLLTGASVVSAGVWRYLGYHAENVPRLRAAWMAIVHPADAPRLQQAIDAHLAGVTPSVEAEYRVQGAHGKWHMIVDRGRAVDHLPTGQPARLLGITADVTEARTAQQARAAAEQRFREIFDSGFQFQFLLDRGGIVLEVNQHALDVAGAAADGVRGRPAWEILWWAGNTEAQERFRLATSAALGGAIQRYEDEVRASDGAAMHLEIAVKPFLDERGAPTQLLVEARDLTARRRAEATLREVDTLTTMGRVAARVAHEINNPLAGIQSSFLLIKGAIPPTHPHFSYVGAIEREIGRIAAVTRQLYETYRPEQDASGSTAVGTVVGDAVAFLEQVNRASGVRVEVDLSRCPSVIALPSAMLRQIAYNLVQNAIEASPAGETVRVSTVAENGHFELRVRDKGAGVPPEVRERIFEPFFSTKGAGVTTGGMGLGLALVHRTVTAAGGKITIIDAEGGGCEFVVTLPLNPISHGV